MQLVPTKGVCTIALCPDLLVFAHFVHRPRCGPAHGLQRSAKCLLTLFRRISSVSICFCSRLLLFACFTFTAIWFCLTIFFSSSSICRHREKEKKKKGKFNLHPYGLDSCQDTLPKKIPSVDLNYSNHVINELTVIEAALISKDPILHTQKHKL